jgi:ion channel
MRAVWLIRICGLLVIVFTLRETFQDLFQPSGSGSLSPMIGRVTFSVCKRIRFLLPSAGGLAILLTILCWSTLVAFGFAIVYWTNIPNGFNMPKLEHSNALSRFGIAFYYSSEALVTLGQGDITPKLAWTRMLSVSEALLGFSLLTASISWIVLIYPALGRMRALSRFAADLIRAEETSGVDILSGDAEGLIGSMAQDVIRTRIDFIHFPLIYYFRAVRERASLPAAAGDLLNLAVQGCGESRPPRVRLAAATLKAALEDFAEMLATRFLQTDTKDPAAVFAAFKRDHLTDQVPTGSKKKTPAT